MTQPKTILLLQGDAEARLLEDADAALEAVFAGGNIRLVRAWAPRVDWLGETAGGIATALPAAEPALQSLPQLLAQSHRMVILSVLPSITRETLRLPDGTAVLAHDTLLAQWPEATVALIRASASVEPPLTPAAALAALEVQVDAWLDQGVAVALCNAFRHVREPLSHGAGDGAAALRDAIRELNLGLARISHRTGCFILDLDRPLAQEGGGPLGVDCFGGAGRAAELALDELASLALDALPVELMGFGDTELEIS